MRRGHPVKMAVTVVVGVLAFGTGCSGGDGEPKPAVAANPSASTTAPLFTPPPGYTGPTTAAGARKKLNACLGAEGVQVPSPGADLNEKQRKAMQKCSRELLQSLVPSATSTPQPATSE